MTWIHKADNTNFNFRAPQGKPFDETYEVLFPVAEVSAAVDLSVAVPVKQMVTILDLGALTANKTLNLAIDAQVNSGALLHVKVASDTTARTLTFGTGLTAPALAGTISKTKVQSFIYNGATFLPLGDALQID